MYRKAVTELVEKLDPVGLSGQAGKEGDVSLLCGIDA